MAAADPGFAALSGVMAEDPRKGSIVAYAKDFDADEQERPVAPDQFDPRYETSKKEIWSWYA